MTIGEAIAIGFLCGYAAALLLNCKPADKPAEKLTINTTLVIDPKVLEQINTAMVTAWLDQRGLTWMPKGAVFDPNKVIK